jgi:DNA-binding beta-propeller fold protein YncE
VIFVNTNNTVFAPGSVNGTMVVWWNANPNTTTTIAINGSNLRSLFVTNDLEIYLDNTYSPYAISRWAINGTQLPSPTPFLSQCFGLFVSITNRLYCSTYLRHQVLSKSLSSPSNTLDVEAGIGSSGSASNQLNYPVGIFVTNALDLYVADQYNHRIQRFRSGDLNGITVAGTGAVGTISLSGPTGVVLDADGYMFIADGSNHRIIGSDQNGFRCVAGCSGSSGATSDTLNFPRALSFDNVGNLWVTDSNNQRIQKFTLISGSSPGE